MAGIHVLSEYETGKTPHWKAAVYSGLVAGLVFLILEMILVPLIMGMSAWAPVRMMAAILLGQGVLPAEGEPATFGVGVLLAALVVHFVLAAIYGSILSLIDFRLEEWAAVAIGAVFGLVIYGINFYGFTAVFPWFEMARGWLGIVTHMVFGIVAAWTYKELAKSEIARERMQRGSQSQ